MPKIKLPIIYSQWDGRWSKEILGYNKLGSSIDIYNYGCLITCLAMVLEYYGKQENPQNINDDLKDANGFAPNTGNYIWGSTKRLFKQITEETHVVTPYPLSDVQIQEIKNYLDRGVPVMVQLDYDPKTVNLDMHFVLLIGYNPNDENDFTIIDPLGGIERSLKHYLGWFRPSARKTIESYTILEGVVPTTDELKDKIIDFDDPEGKRRSVFWYVKAWYDQKVDKANQKAIYESKLLEKDKAFQQTTTLLTTASKEVARKEVEIQNLLIKKVELEKENDNLIDQNASLYTLPQLVEMLLKKLKPL